MLKINKNIKNELINAKKRLSGREISCDSKSYANYMIKEFLNMKHLIDRANWIDRI